MLKAALTHDVDRIDKSYQVLTHALRNLLKGNLHEFVYHVQSFPSRKSTYWGFDDIIRLEENFHIRSTFFFLNESIPFNLLSPRSIILAIGRYDIHDKRVLHVMKTLDESGWEVGMHGSFRSYKSISLLKNEKRELEYILGHPVIGIRQHYLNLSDETWGLQRACGFRYDTSFGFSSEIGFKDNRIAPFRPFNDSFMVFPQVIMDLSFIQDPERWSKLDSIIEEASNHDGIVVINWHNNYFDEKEFPGFRSTYIKIIETLLKNNAVIKTLGAFCNESSRGQC